jgi:hypothetical protein
MGKAPIFLVGYGLWMVTAWAQTGAQQPLQIGGVAITGSLRTRIESWDWFQGNANNEYTFTGSIARIALSESKRTWEWQLEFAAPFLLGLPDDAVAIGTQGQQGFGASYFAANSKARNAAMVFPRQGFVRFKNLGGREGQSLKIGRTEFIDGMETSPKNATLAALKQDRIAHRLIGNFGFSDVGRSFDGAVYALNSSKLNLTMFAGRPTRGVFQVDGWGEVKVNVFYGALTGQVTGRQNNGEWRIFGLGYQDLRDGVVKTDNRPLAIRTSDTGHIGIGAFGGHYIHTTGTTAGTVDFLAWGAVQTGSWGSQRQRSRALALEAGYQPKILPRLRPWLRGGYDYGSGDRNPSDATHATFFQVLPTPRVYARFPFFNMMNDRDIFGELALRPAKRITVRSNVHSLRLATGSDLWYSGGGAYQPWTFGYTGRASGGNRGLANLYDISADYNVNAHFSASMYFGHAAGKMVIQSIYPNGKSGNLGFVELMFRM